MDRIFAGCLRVLVGFFLLAAGLYPASAEGSRTVIADSVIAEAIEDDLAWDDGVSAHLIDVDVEEGIVRLSGQVGSMLEHDRAVRLARTFKGVRGIIDNMTIEPVDRTDRQVENDVERALMVDPAVDVHEIRVRVNAKKAILEGEVDSWAEKLLANQAAKGVAGLRAVENKLRVSEPVHRSDKDIQADIERLFLWDPRIYPSSIDVSVTDGMVVLKGRVRSYAELNYAVERAAVEGVRQVDPRPLEVHWWDDRWLKKNQPPVRRDDAAIRDAVLDALLHDPRVGSLDVGVSVDSAVVTLSGELNNLRAERAAVEDARNVLGVVRVRNRLVVRPDRTVADARLSRDIQDAVRWDPYLTDQSLQVHVVNAKAFLYGTVDNWFLRNRAHSVASGIDGVVEVANHIKVHEEPWSLKSDVAIRSDVEDRLEIAWDVDEDDVDVEVDDGVVHITGTVDNYSQYSTVMLSAFAGGARSVESDLTIDGIPFPAPHMPRPRPNHR